MKRFEFKLGRLARVRKAQEEMARAAWQAAEAVAREIDDQLRSSGADIERAFEYQRQIQASLDLDPNRVLHAFEAIQSMERVRDRLRARLDGARAEAEALRAPWQVLRTKLEGLKRLEETARTEHRSARERAEAAEADQIAIERATLSKNRSQRRGA